jgi:hypothetical protein
LSVCLSCQQNPAAKPHPKTASQRERSENTRGQTGQQNLIYRQNPESGHFFGAPFQQLLSAQSGLVPQTDSKGVLWRIFAYFLFLKKVNARPDMRGKPCASKSLTVQRKEKILLKYDAQKTAVSKPRVGCGLKDNTRTCKIINIIS